MAKKVRHLRVAGSLTVLCGTEVRPHPDSYGKKGEPLSCTDCMTRNHPSQTGSVNQSADNIVAGFNEEELATLLAGQSDTITKEAVLSTRVESLLDSGAESNHG